jgi:hypothetical protein
MDDAELRELIPRLTARVAAACGRGWKCHPEDPEPNRRVLHAIARILDRADEEERLRQRNRLLTQITDILSNTVRAMAADPEVTQFDVELLLRRGLEAGNLVPVDLEIDVDPDADLALRGEDGPIETVRAALSRHVGRSHGTISAARRDTGPPLRTIAGRYVSPRVVRQLMAEVPPKAAQGHPIELAELGDFDAETSRRVDANTWALLRDGATDASFYRWLVDSPISRTDLLPLRSLLISKIEKLETLCIVASLALQACWLPADDAAQPILARWFPPGVREELLAAVHGREPEWAITLVLAMSRAGLHVDPSIDKSPGALEGVRRWHITKRVTADFADRMKQAFTSAEAAGEL